MSTGILDQVRAPHSQAAAPGETDRRGSGGRRERTSSERGTSTRQDQTPARGRPSSRGTSSQGTSGRGTSGRGTSGQGTSGQGTSSRGWSAQGRSAQGWSAQGWSAQGWSAQGRPNASRTRTRTDARSGGTAPFVLLIMVLLTSGLVATLWLSTAAAADSYRLNSERQHARDLSEQTERLHRDVASAQSAPAIAAAAQREGLVPAGEPAVLLVAPNGSTRVIGSPRPARAAPASPAPRPVAPRTIGDPEATAQTATAQTAATQTAATQTAATQSTPGQSRAADAPSVDVPSGDVPSGDAQGPRE